MPSYLKKGSIREVLCACGCGEVVSTGRKYKRGHNNRAKTWSDPSTREKASEATKKQRSDPSTREKASEATKNRWEDPALRKKQSDRTKKRFEDPAEREKQSVAQKKRFEDPAERKKISDAVKKRFEDPAERENVSGENNSNWQGGTSFGKYCPKFNENKKQEIRDKYDNCDYVSGIPAHICNVANGKVRKLSVHHVDYNKQQGCDDHEWRLIPVSTRHNTIFNTNRPFWNRLLTYSLQYDETYYDTEPLNIKKYGKSLNRYKLNLT